MNVTTIDRKIIEFINTTGIGMTDLYDMLIDACIEGDESLLVSILTFVKNWKIEFDVCNNNGYVGIVAIRNENYNIIDILIEHDNKFLKVCGDDMLNHAVSHGKTEAVKYLLSKHVDPSPLKGTTWWNNYKHITPLLTEYLANKNNPDRTITPTTQ